MFATTVLCTVYTIVQSKRWLGEVPQGRDSKSNFYPLFFLQGIKNKLLAFFLRGRPSIDDLFNRGIMKNEPVFGSTLEELQATDLCPVPR